MVTLRRTVRVALSTGEPPGDADANGFGGRPALTGWGTYCELTVACSGVPHGATGYLINIKDIDRAVRESVVPALSSAMESGTPPAACVPGLLVAARRAIPCNVDALTLHMTPTHAIHTENGMGDTVIISQRFEFAAAHRLHTPSLSDEENRRFFGKCNNPAGHGHNYVVEPRVEVRVGERAPAFTLRDLEGVTMRVLIEPFDHKHLNIDTPEFRDGSGVNPTVENIARVFYSLLSPEIARAGGGAGTSGAARLVSIKVWETDRTSAEFGG